MIVRLKNGLLVVSPSEGSDTPLSTWITAHTGQVFRLEAVRGGTALLRALGPETEVCRLPLNVHSGSPEPLSLVSNLAPTPFSLDGEDYASVEGFWQGLKFPDVADRRRIASLSGILAKHAGGGAPAADVIVYQGETVPVGTADHWRLMERACAAKFAQHAGARAALLGTGTRPLEHRMRRDSRTIPGVVMAEIRMRLRARLQRMQRSGDLAE